MRAYLRRRGPCRRNKTLEIRCFEQANSGVVGETNPCFLCYKRNKLRVFSPITTIVTYTCIYVCMYIYIYIYIYVLMITMNMILMIIIIIITIVIVVKAPANL